MDDRFLSGRSALVTGSTSGIGLAIATALAAAGARVAINGLGDAAQVDAAIARVDAAGDGGTRHFPADLRDPDAIAAMMEALAADGAPDVLVNNAGVQHAAALAEMPAGRWDAILAVNLSAAFHAMRAALPGMAARGYGRVVNIASVHGLVASVHKAPYVASKFGLVGLSKVAALEYAAAGDRDSGGVTVNCICPGPIRTGMTAPIPDEAKERFARRRVPMRRYGDPEEVAQITLSLVLPAASYLTGAIIPVDGGLVVQNT